MRGFEGKKEKKEMMQLCYIFFKKNGSCHSVVTNPISQLLVEYEGRMALKSTSQQIWVGFFEQRHL